MYLKSIEIHGFKSFANKIILDFHDGITGIVGPNGSGKSNVSDAVRWVLGEQSAKQLRGAKMEDVIFSGTELRKPLGFAYVAITLDNSDHSLPISYEQVTVARRVYRSGESEYLLNGTSCRLRDVQELFLDTGIGKEGYSIIGQGQIDKILSGKPEERRELFDEAAGITKFKKRKAITEKNLEEQRQNLCRVNDILSEIEKQIIPLEKQSLTAKEFLRLKEELKQFDINLFLLEYDRLYKERNMVKGHLTIAENNLAVSKKEYENTKEEYEKLESDLTAYNVQIEKQQALLHETTLLKQQSEGNIKLYSEQIQTASANEALFQERYHELEKEKKEKEKELDIQSQKKQITEESITSLNTKHSEALLQLNEVSNQIKSITFQIEQKNNEIIAALNQNTGVKTQKQRYETMLEQNNIKKAEFVQKLLKNKSNEAVFEEKQKFWELELESLERDLLKRTERREKLSQELENLKQESYRLSNLISEKQREYHKESSRLESLNNITERYEGFGNSIRRIMEQKQNNPGIIGVVADIIKVSEKYETAIEIALGGSIQNIVTEDEYTAKQMIAYLKKNKFGRATFLPLTSLKNPYQQNRTALLKEQGVIGMADSLVSAEPKFALLLGYLLGKTIVADTIDHALALAKKYQYSLRIVTLEGEQLNPGGSLSGGAYKNSSNLLSRRREIAELEKRKAILKKEGEQLNNELKAIQGFQKQKEEKLELEKVKYQELQLAKNSISMNVAQLLERKNENQLEYDTVKLEAREIENQVWELNDNLKVLNKSLAANEQQNKDRESLIEHLNQRLLSERTKEKELNEIVSALKTESLTLEQTRNFILENSTRINTELIKTQNEIYSVIEKQSQAASLKVEKEKEQQNLNTLISSQNIKIIEITENLSTLQQKKEAIQNSHKSFFAKRESISEEITLLEKEVLRLTNQIEKFAEQQETQMNYMWEEYEVSYNKALSFKQDNPPSVNEMKKEIAKRKTDIKNLGAVNVNAIEDYKNLIERFTLLKTQKEDIVQSEEALRKIIDELVQAMRSQFAEKFATIKEQFDKVFKELFGGGKGTLELMEEEDILEAGIRIIAQPPGKKLQNMMQLSGGEKALTAISLLFAIQNLKPSPFCLLDEIEAALDDSNVKRYAKYLHKLTKHTQFIIITHRRGTMSAADILYGITMQEKGISTLVSVNLIENDLDK